jgi:hypothetical protein
MVAILRLFWAGASEKRIPTLSARGPASASRAHTHPLTLSLLAYFAPPSPNSSPSRLPSSQGELLTDARLPCTATAATRVEMLEMAREDVRYLFRRRPLLMSRIQQRARLGYTASWAAIGANSVFANFSMSQVRRQAHRSFSVLLPPGSYSISLHLFRSRFAVYLSLTAPPSLCGSGTPLFASQAQALSLCRRRPLALPHLSTPPYWPAARPAD